MALNFEKIITLSDSSIVDDPIIAAEACISNEAQDNEIIQYHINDNVAADRAGYIVESDYDALTLKQKTARLTSRAVSKIGIKNFPGLGSYGFFKYFYTGDSKVLIPINAYNKRMPAPVIVVTPGASSINVVITEPTSIDYLSFKIIFKNGEFKYEYTTYDNSVDLPLPLVKGTYDIYCIGYVNEGERVSINSNVVEYKQLVGNDDFTPSINNVLSSSVSYDKTLLATGWVGNIYSLSVAGVTVNSNQDVLPSEAITQAQYESLAGAGIVATGQSIETIELTSFGTVPVIDIPIVVIVRGA